MKRWRDLDPYAKQAAFVIAVFGAAYFAAAIALLIVTGDGGMLGGGLCGLVLLASLVGLMSLANRLFPTNPSEKGDDHA